MSPMVPDDGNVTRMQMPRWAAIPRNLSIQLGDEELSERMRMAQ